MVTARTIMDIDWCEDDWIRYWASENLETIEPIPFTSIHRLLAKGTLSQLESQAFQSPQKLRELKRSIWELRARLCAVRLLPPEILSKVFEHLRDIEPQPFVYKIIPRGNGGRKPDPLQIGMVCKRWREVAFSTPSLWTSVSIDMQQVPPDKMPTPLLVARTLRGYLERSKNVPLTIFQQNGVLDHGHWDLLAAHSTRWKKVDISALGDLTIFFSGRRRFEYLTSLSLLYPHSNRPFHKVKTLKNTLDIGPPLKFPILESLIVDARFLRFLGRVEAPVMADLSIHESFLPRALLETLPVAFPVLAHLQLWRTTIASPTNPPSFPRLKSCIWSLGDNDRRYMFPFLQDSPSLTSLQLEYRSRNGIRDSKFISLPSVQELCLTFGFESLGANDPAIVPQARLLLECFPSVQVLKLQGAPLEDALEVTQELLNAGSGAGSFLCPDLNRLTFLRCGCYKSTCRTILKILRQRKKASSLVSVDGHLRVDLLNCKGGFNDFRDAGISRMEKAVKCAIADPDSATYWSGDEILGTTFTDPGPPEDEFEAPDSDWDMM